MIDFDKLIKESLAQGNLEAKKKAKPKQSQQSLNEEAYKAGIKLATKIFEQYITGLDNSDLSHVNRMRQIRVYEAFIKRSYLYCIHALTWGDIKTAMEMVENNNENNRIIINDRLNALKLEKKKVIKLLDEVIVEVAKLKDKIDKK